MVGVHAVDDGQRLDTNAFFTQFLAAVLEAFFNHNAHADSGGFGLFYHALQTTHGFAIGQEVIDDDDLVARL